MKKLYNTFINACNKMLATWKLEYRLIFSDTAVVFSFLIISILVAFAYSYLYSGQVINEMPIAVVDNDNATESRLLLRMIDQTPQAKIAYSTAEMGEAEKLFHSQEIHGIVVIPNNFTKELTKGLQPTVSMYADASYMLYYKQIYRAVKTATTYMNAGIELKKMKAKGVSTAEAMQSIRPVVSEAVGLYNLESGYGRFVMPAIFLIIIQTTMLTGIGLLGGTHRELKKNKEFTTTVNNLLDAVFVLFGKAGAYSSIALLVLFIMLGFISPLLDIPQRGNVGEVLLFVLPFVFTISFLGITLNAFFKHREDAVMTIVFTSIPAMLLCGVSWPVTEIPPAMAGVARLIPTTASAKGFIAMTQCGASLGILRDIWVEMWILCSFYFILSIFSMKKTVQ